MIFCRSKMEDEVMEDISAKNSNNSKYKTWVEKYRPTNLSEIVFQDEVVKTLNNIIGHNVMNLPNFLFYGPPGTGKTSTIIALAKQIYGEEYQTKILELNASDERGIQVIREKVKNFAQSTVSSISKCPPIKIIILDECDSMTKDAQSALRRIMEKYAATTRFCLICNYVSKIIDPIMSRCSVFRFKLLKSDLIKKTLLNISKSEGFKINDDSLDILIQISEGDMRKAITLLQTLALISDDNEIKNEDIHEIAGVVPQKLIERFFNICKSNSFKILINEVDKLVKAGYSVAQFFNQLQEWIALADEELLNDNQKSKICERIAINDKRLLDGADEYLQLLDVGACIKKAVANTN